MWQVLPENEPPLRLFLLMSSLCCSETVEACPSDRGRSNCRRIRCSIRRVLPSRSTLLRLKSTIPSGPSRLACSAPTAFRRALFPLTVLKTRRMVLPDASVRQVREWNRGGGGGFILSLAGSISSVEPDLAPRVHQFIPIVLLRAAPRLSLPSFSLSCALIGALAPSDFPLSIRIICAPAQILRDEGPSALYKGFSVVIVGTIPARILYLSTLEFTKYNVRTIATDKMGLSPTTAVALSDFCAGASASCAAQAIIVPIDVVSQNMMIQSRGKGDGPAPSGARAAPARHSASVCVHQRPFASPSRL